MLSDKHNKDIEFEKNDATTESYNKLLNISHQTGSKSNKQGSESYLYDLETIGGSSRKNIRLRSNTIFAYRDVNITITPG
jgi:hypothetical protein